MLDLVVLENFWQNVKVSAYTDRYAHDPANEALLFISLAGNEQAVKAVSSAIIACKTVGIRREGQSEHLVHGHPASRYRIMSTKLASGALHQIVADTRFYANSDGESRLIVVPDDSQPHEQVYSQVLASSGSPVIAEWSQWIYDRLHEMGRITEMAGTLKVVEIRVDDRIVDEIVSEGIRMGTINFNEQGGSYAGVH
jgi:hypothetical protein